MQGNIGETLPLGLCVFSTVAECHTSFFIKGTGQVHTECERKSKITSPEQSDGFPLSIQSPLRPQNLILWRS